MPWRWPKAKKWKWRFGEKTNDRTMGSQGPCSNTKSMRSTSAIRNDASTHLANPVLAARLDLRNLSALLSVGYPWRTDSGMHQAVPTSVGGRMRRPKHSKVCLRLLLLQVMLAASCGNSTFPEASITTKIAPGTVSATGHPLVARYSINVPRDANVTVEFGLDTHYGLRTWSRPTPPGGGTVELLVAGMRQFSTYHMRAVVDYLDGSKVADADKTFTTGGLPPERVPQITVQRPSGLPHNSGVELLALLSGSTNQLQAGVMDLDGNLIWYYDYEQVAGALRPPEPLALLSNGNFLINVRALQAMREIDLEGNVIRELNYDDLNQALAAAGFNLVVDGIHHDVALLPDKHAILLVYEDRDFTDLPGYPGVTSVRGDALIDLDPDWKPVWVWSAFDHLDINRQPMDFPDWTHSNAVVYTPDDGNLLLSIRHQHWLIKIDYQDGRGSGQVLWRLGYEGDFVLEGGGPPDWFYAQHFPFIIGPESANIFKLAIFDNGNNRVLDESGTACDPQLDIPCFSRAVTMSVNEPARTARVLWEYKSSFYSAALGSITVFDDGNVEFNMGLLFMDPLRASVLEVTPEAVPRIVWQLDIYNQFAYRAYRIPSLYLGVQW